MFTKKIALSRKWEKASSRLVTCHLAIQKGVAVVGDVAHRIQGLKISDLGDIERSQTQTQFLGGRLS
jgi:hypothetical protein